MQIFLKGDPDISETLSTIYKNSLKEINTDFSREELMLLIDAFNGAKIIPGNLGLHIIPNIQDGDIEKNLCNKWEIDKKTFFQRINNMTSAQKAALELWAANFWVTADITEDKVTEKYVGELIAMKP